VTKAVEEIKDLGEAELKYSGAVATAGDGSIWAFPENDAATLSVTRDGCLVDFGSWSALARHVASLREASRDPLPFARLILKMNYFRHRHNEGEEMALNLMPIAQDKALFDAMSKVLKEEGLGLRRPFLVYF